MGIASVTRAEEIPKLPPSSRWISTSTDHGIRRKGLERTVDAEGTATKIEESDFC